MIDFLAGGRDGARAVPGRLPAGGRAPPAARALVRDAVARLDAQAEPRPRDQDRPGH